MIGAVLPLAASQRGDDADADPDDDPQDEGAERQLDGHRERSDDQVGDLLAACGTSSPGTGAWHSKVCGAGAVGAADEDALDEVAVLLVQRLVEAQPVPVGLDDLRGCRPCRRSAAPGRRAGR